MLTIKSKKKNVHDDYKQEGVNVCDSDLVMIMEISGMNNETATNDVMIWGHW